MQDLEIIFSRFGNITSCDIIKDWKTGDSLCYAFLGFDSDEACEEAYFKMNNCLIDDRRIKVRHSATQASQSDWFTSAFQALGPCDRVMGRSAWTRSAWPCKSALRKKHSRELPCKDIVDTPQGGPQGILPGGLSDD